MFFLKLHQLNRSKHLAVWIAITLVRCYQLLVSPVLSPACRFSPSCSQYAIEALERYGLIKGANLAIKRLLRCHPWNDGGFDPVP